MPIKFPIYLDNHATTPCDPRVFEAMRPWSLEDFGNPASATHAYGWKAEEAVKKAREQVARLIHADPREILWTSGTTESVNLAIQGVALSYRKKGNHLITTTIEHRSVLQTMRYLESTGFKVTCLPVNRQGLVDPEQLRREIRPETILISIIGASNEVGTVHPVQEIGRIAKENGVIFHVDAAQACGKIPIDLEAMGIDLLSISAHKVYGPKGIGALSIRRRKPAVHLTPLFRGGSREEELRPGTLPVPLIVGMGVAFEIAEREMEGESKRLAALRDHLKEGLMSRLDDVYLNGSATERLPGNLNLSFPPIRSSDLMSAIPEIAVSSGSACASGSTEPSYVIQALGVGEERARSSIRFGLGRFTTEAEVDFAADALAYLRGLPGSRRSPWRPRKQRLGPR